MYLEVIIAGFGGQGVMLAGEVICEAATRMGINATFFPSYGPETRGGTANCTVIVSDKPIASPVLATSDNIIVMNRPSLDKFEPRVKKSGLLIVNSSLVDRKVERDDIEVLEIPANKIAEDVIGNPLTANMIVLGAFITKTGVIPLDEIKKAVEKFLGEKKKHLVEVNFKALDEGAKLVK